MKNLLLFISYFFFSFSIGTAQINLEKDVRFEYVETSLKEILQDISIKNGFSISYGNTNLNEIKTISYSGKLKEGLNRLLIGTSIEYKVIGDQLVLKEQINKTQTVKGKVLDIDTKQSIIGASIVVLNSNPLKGTTTDIDGYFTLQSVPLGRQDIKISFIGYEPVIKNQVLVSSGKELTLNIEMSESYNQIKTFNVVAKTDKTKAQNDMATVSARSFTVEETQRYAGSFKDPARMAQSFAGVTGGGDDLENEIIIRGNSARGLQWRLEGIEIPSPNHFGDMGSGGGAISMLSSSTLSNSDFYTGAFPSEFGNALSGVFDLKLREGNSEKREYSLMIGALGLEASAEGYFSKKSKASYLINYRYSTTALLKEPLNLVGVPVYQDISFKLNFPTKKAGTFALFGLGGTNSNYEPVLMDTSEWGGADFSAEYYEGTKLGILGFSHKLPINKKSYLNTTIAVSNYQYRDSVVLYKYKNNEVARDALYDLTSFGNYNFTGSLIYNYKFNIKHKIRTGIIANHQAFDFNSSSIIDDVWLTFFDNKGSTQILRSFLQWKYRITRQWTLNSGFHLTHLVLNKTTNIDPRAAIKYQFNSKQSIALSVGMHSKPEHISTYFLDRVEPNGEISFPNKNLKMLKAIHFVLGYDISITDNLRLKAEAYYQHLYDIPVSNKASSSFSILNTADIFDVINLNDKQGESLVSEGTGKNYGIDITLERFFKKGFYFMFTASVFDSKYKTIGNKEYNTRYNNNYVFNMLGGKEYKVGKTKQNLLSFNGKVKYLGGIKFTPIDLNASKANGYQTFVPNSEFSAKSSDYFRLDVGISFKLNKKKITHTFSVDIQNATNKQNDSFQYYENSTQQIMQFKQNGLIPIINYRLEF